MTARDTLRAMLDELSDSEADELLGTLRQIATGRQVDRGTLSGFRAVLIKFSAEATSVASAAITVGTTPHRRDALDELLDNAPLDDEPTTPEEEAAVQEALDAAARGETITLNELRAELR
jgi:hypothetical protein